MKHDAEFLEELMSVQEKVLAFYLIRYVDIFLH